MSFEIPGSREQLVVSNLETAYKERFDEKLEFNEQAKLDRAVQEVRGLLNDPDLEVRKKTQEELQKAFNENPKIAGELKTLVFGKAPEASADRAEITESERKVLVFFGFDKVGYLGLNKAKIKAKDVGLEFSLDKTLGGYQNFIEGNFSDLNPKLLGNVKKNIRQRFEKLASTDLSSIKNRFILNEEISDFLKTDEIKKILDVAKFARDYEKAVYKNNPVEESEMNYTQTPEGVMVPLGYSQKTTYPLDREYRTACAFLEKVGEGDVPSFSGLGNINLALEKTKNPRQTAAVPEINFLNEKDQATEAKAMLWYLATIAPQLIPVAGDILSVAVDLPDAFSGSDTTMKYLKSTGAVPEDYELSKHWYDNVFAGLGVVGSIFSLNEISKMPRVARILEKLAKIPVQIIEKIAKEDAHLTKAFEFFGALRNPIGPEAVSIQRRMDEFSKAKKSPKSEVARVESKTKVPKTETPKTKNPTIEKKAENISKGQNEIQPDRENVIQKPREVGEKRLKEVSLRYPEYKLEDLDKIIEIEDFLKFFDVPKEHWRNVVKSGKINTMTISYAEKVEIPVYKYHGGIATGDGYFYTEQWIEDVEERIKKFALDSEYNSATEFSEKIVIEGAPTIRSEVAPNYGQPGGGQQIYVPHKKYIK